MGNKDSYFEIKSRAGEVVFRRWRILQTRWLNIFLHNIRRADGDKHMHSHPWSFVTLVLRGGYKEERRKCHGPSVFGSILLRVNKFPCWPRFNRHGDFHRSLEIYGETGAWTLVFAGPDKHPWGFLMNDGTILPNEEYRQRKAAGTLPE